MIEFILKSIGVLLIIYTSIIYFVLKELNKIDFMDRLDEPWDDWEGDEV